MSLEAFAMYGLSVPTRSLDALLVEQWEHGMLLARAEESGAEGCYVEVARYNTTTDTWQRYAFAKCLGGEHPDEPDAKAIRTADLFAAEINTASNMPSDWRPPLIHRMPNYEGKI